MLKVHTHTHTNDKNNGDRYMGEVQENPEH